MKTILRWVSTLLSLLIMLSLGMNSVWADEPQPVGVPTTDGTLAVIVDTLPQNSLSPEVIIKSDVEAPQGGPAADESLSSTLVQGGGTPEQAIVAVPQSSPVGPNGIADMGTTSPLGTVTVTSVWTADGSGNSKTSFKQGDQIRYYGSVSNTNAGAVTAYFKWSLSGPCGSSTLWEGNLSTGSGTWWWYLPRTLASNACAGTYTYTLAVTYNGSTSSKSTTYSVSATDKKKVVLDPGHGWCTRTPGANCRVDPGASGNGMLEKDVVLDIANRIKPLLEARGVLVYMTRTGDDPYHKLSYVSRFVNQTNPVIDVSIHANAGGGTGTEACYQYNKPTTPQSKDLSTRLTNSISAKLSLTNRGIYSEYDSGRCGRGGQLYIHDMLPTASLVETAFIDNASDADKLRNRRQDFAQAIADAIVAYLGLP